MNVFMILIYSITEIYQVICINEIMKINHDKREKPILPEYVIWSGAILVLNLVLFLIGVPIVNFLTSCVVIFVCGQLLFNGTWKSKIYSTVFLCILGAAIEMVVVACIFILYKNGLIESMSSQNTMLFGAVASKFLLYANIKIIAKKAGKQKADIPDTHWMILALIAMTNIYILYLVAEAAQKMETEVFRIQSMIVYIMIIIINYLEFYVHDQMIKRTDYILQNRLLEQQACFYETQLKDREFVELEIRKLKHNISNHYICLQKYADDKDLEGLQSYLKELVEELPSAHGVSNSGNTVIDSILNYKINQGRALGIEFGLKVEVPDSVGVERSSLSVILGNALDNATV